MTLKDPTSTNVLSGIFWEAACARHRVPLFRNSQFSRCWLESGGHTYRQVTNMQVRWWLFEQSSSFFQSYLIFPLPSPTARNQKCSPKEFLSQRLWGEKRVWGVQHQTSVTQMHLSKGEYLSDLGLVRRRYELQITLPSQLNRITKIEKLGLWKAKAT